MAILYFTDGETLKDHEMFQLCLRIPEVMGALRQNGFTEGDAHFEKLLDQEAFKKIKYSEWSLLVSSVQQGLFENWLQLRVPYQETFYRRSFKSVSAAVSALSQDPQQEIYVFGPGFDEVAKLLENKKMKVYESIEENSQLSWFWGYLRPASSIV